MNSIKKILIPTDFSASALSAINYTCRFVGSDQSLEIFLLHVAEQPLHEESRQVLTQKLQEAKAELMDSCRASQCETILKEGNLTEVILETQTEKKVDLIMMGTAGAQASNETTSRTADLVYNADCPVLVIPAQIDAFRIQKIALALDMNDIDDFFCLNTMHDIARWFDAEVHILTINNREDKDVTPRQTVEDTLDYYLDTLNYYHAFPKNTDIEKGIAGYISANNIDLLIILPRNHAKKSSPSEGRLTRLLTLHTQIPLLTV